MPVAITALYAALLGGLQIVLQQLVGRERLRVGVSLGDGDDVGLREAMRRHGNFLEQVPLALLLIALAELNGAAPAWIHGLGGGLLVSRLAHPWGVKQEDARQLPRFLGALGTLLVQIAAVALLLWQVVGG